MVNWLHADAPCSSQLLRGGAPAAGPLLKIIADPRPRCEGQPPVRAPATTLSPFCRTVLMESTHNPQRHETWNKGKLVGQKTPFKLKEIWAIRIRLQMQERLRALALFDLGIDSKLRACDLVRLRVRDVCHGDRVAARAMVLQQKTRRPVQFEITASTREAMKTWIKRAGLKFESFLFPSRVRKSPHLGTRQYARIVDHWVEQIGLDPASYGTHSMRRTKASLICRRTRNLRAVQLLLGHTKLESTIRYLGIEVDDALEIAEQTEV